MTHLDTWHSSYSQKKGRESHWQFDFRPLKVQNHPDFLTCMWPTTYYWKALNKGYNFALNFISIRGLHAKLWASEVVGVPIVGILGFTFGSPKTKWHLGVGLVGRHKIYYKGEGGGFPQVRVMVSLVSQCLLVPHPCIKVITTH
jgi:hypothetical protein